MDDGYKWDWHYWKRFELGQNNYFAKTRREFFGRIRSACFNLEPYKGYNDDKQLTNCPTETTADRSRGLGQHLARIRAFQNRESEIWNDENHLWMEAIHDLSRANFVKKQRNKKSFERSSDISLVIFVIMTNWINLSNPRSHWWMVFTLFRQTDEFWKEDT